MNRTIKYITFLVLTLFVLGCSSTRHLPFGSYSLEPLTEVGLVEKISATENNEAFTQISRFTAEYAGVQEQSNFKGYVRIAQDSLLMMSLSPGMGGEAMRMLLSSETSKMLNRVESTYAETSYAASQQMIPLPYELLQALLSYHFSDLVTKDYTLSIKDKMYNLEDKKKKKNYTSIQVDGRFMVRKLYYKDFVENSSVSVLYNSFFEVDGQLFPQDVAVTINNKRASAVLRLSFRRVDFKESLSFPFHVSSRYIRIH
ncbi:MAG: DUF4292 domain-containing protein [Bacteroidales bacterium]|jgi:uncharacterized lipoprotein NlpE involved in copper resistance|nr:DUF4292 domain-containing protein [Bacteroidales bacterium]